MSASSIASALGDPGVRGTGALLEVGDGTGNSFAKADRRLPRWAAAMCAGRMICRSWAVDGAVLPPLQRATRWLDLDVVKPARRGYCAGGCEAGDRDLAYRLVRSPDGGFGLAPPYHQRPVLAALGRAWWRRRLRGLRPRM